MAAVVATAASATASSVGAGATSPDARTTSFGGPVAVRVAHVGRIEVDLEGAGATGLRRIRCDGVPAGSACFVAR